MRVLKKFTSAPELAVGIADQLAHTIVGALAVRGVAHVVLTGGRIGTACLAALREHPLTADIPWDGVHFWWSDERFVRAGDSERNDVGASAELLNSLNLPEEHVHRMPASDQGLTLSEAAETYWAEIVAIMADDITFDVCLLGVGEDGHVASLFPHLSGIEDNRVSVIPVTDSPKPPSERLTFTRPLIDRSRQVWLLASGSAKADAVATIMDVEAAPLPAATVEGLSRTILFVDTDAAAGLPPTDEPESLFYGD